MDFAQRRKNVGLVRKMEKYATFSSYLFVRVILELKLKN